MSVHALAERYLDELYDLSDALQVRKAEADALAAAMTGGQHLCLRGFWRVGKTTMMKAVLKNACARTGGAAFMLDLRDPTRDDGMVASVESVWARLADKVNEFLKRVGATDAKADPKNPLAVLGELAAPIYVGIDELIALHSVGEAKAREFLQALVATPKNVKLVMVAHRHRDLDVAFDTELVLRPDVHSTFIRPVTDEELIHLVQTPAQALGVVFSDEALGSIATLAGNRPVEVFTLCALVASKLPPDFKGTVTDEQVESLVTFDAVAEDEAGRELVDTYLRVLVTAMSPEERALMELLAAGGEGEVPADALQMLQAVGYITEGEGFVINGTLLEGLTRAVADGSIKVAVA